MTKKITKIDDGFNWVTITNGICKLTAAAFDDEPIKTADLTHLKSIYAPHGMLVLDDGQWQLTFSFRATVLSQDWEEMREAVETMIEFAGQATKLL